MTFSRRHFLQSVSVGSLALSVMRTSSLLAQDKPLPKRLLVVFTPNGTIPEAWGADGTGRDFKLRTILEPLTPFQDHIAVLSGLDMTAADDGPGDGHQQGMGQWLTGAKLLPGDIKGGCDSCPAASFAGGISVDQAIANALGQGTRFRSLELGVLVSGGENTWNRMCYAGAGQPLPPEDNPALAFDRVFGKISADPFGAEKRAALKKSVLDFVHADFAVVKRKLGAEDRQKLDLHETTLRDIEVRLGNPGALGAACVVPGKPNTLDINAQANAPMLGKLQMDMITMAFACDLTRVASLQWTNSVGQLVPSWLGFTDRHHDLSHEGDSNTDAKNKLIKINRWYAEQFAYFLGQLAKIPEGNGTLLDNTLVVWGNELGKGNSHTRSDTPFVLAGKAGGALKTGQVLRFDKRPHNDLLLTIARAMGLSQATFGEASSNTGPIAQLLA